MQITNTSRADATTPGKVSGNTTWRNTRQGEAPRLSAACSTRLSSRSMTPSIGKIANGTANWTMPMTIAGRPGNMWIGSCTTCNAISKALTAPLSRSSALNATTFTSTVVRKATTTRVVRQTRATGPQRQIAAAIV